jgi:hypothetical protein
MGLVDFFRGRLKEVWHGSNEEYELDEEWRQLLEQLREEIERDGFDLQDNEELYLSIMAHVVEENREGFEMLAEEEAAERARMNEEKDIEESSGVKIRTISPSSD